VVIREKHLKILILLILLYQHFYAEAFGQIPFLLTGLYIALDIGFVIYNFSKIRHLRISSSCTYLVLFMGYAVLFGFFITAYRNAFIGYVVNSVEYVVLFLTVYEIVQKEKKAHFFVISMFAISLAGIIIALTRQQYIFSRLVISLHSNANSLGNLCIICVCTGIYIAFCFKKGWISLILSAPVAFYAAILTASKKALLISVLVLALYIIFRYFDWLKEHFVGVITCTIAIAVILFVKRTDIIKAWETTTVYTRIQRASDIDIGRLDLYREAFNVFKQHPLFGVGFQCFQYYSTSGLYAHSAYAEVLAGTGIIGVALWGMYYLSILLKSIHLAYSNKKSIIYLWSFVWIICQMVLDTTSVSLYSPINMALLGVVVAILETDNIISRRVEQDESAVLLS
jgi:O-antigen ligase